MKNLVRIFNTEHDSTFDFFDDMDLDWNGMHQEIGLDQLLDDMKDVIIEVVNKEVVEDDRARMIRAMQKELYEFYVGKLKEWVGTEIDYAKEIKE